MFFKKKKDEPHKGDTFLAKGIYLRQPMMNNGNIVFNCFMRSLIVFLLVFGSIGGFLSAFHISYNYLLVIFFYLILSMYFSFLYASRKFVYRDLGYILFFFLFVASIFYLRIYANSGFYVIINRVLQAAQAFFNLAGVREYDIQISNDYLTVAVVAIFVGMVVIIILNIWLYSTMSLGWAVFLTFPLLCVPLYMKLTPDLIYILFLGAGYMAVVIFKANGHYLAFAWDAPFHVKGRKKDRVTYTQDGGVFRQILLRVIVLGFCLVILVGFLFPANYFEASFKNDRLREKTSDTIANFVLLGFMGMFNHYASTGGMSGGKLGGISNVRPDYLPDLLVSFTPYDNEAIYLKGYTGGIYGDNQWESIYNNYQSDAWQDDIEIFQEESLKKEVESLQKDMGNNGPYSAYGIMDVKNVGADTSYLYYPYYTAFEDYSIYNNHSMMSSIQGLGLQQQTEYYYYPKQVWEPELGEDKPRQMDVEQINPIFLDVPEKNQEVIREMCDKIGLNEEMSENDIIEAVQNYFTDNIPYTLKPGATPGGEDFVNYFLTKNKKGFCAHFASAATLIFREMGIPARYVEGYAFSLEAVLASDENKSKQYDDYFYGYSMLGRSTVMDVEVTDAMAHAWVEVYVDGFGWKVAEVTPGSNEAAEEDDFWSAFAAFLNGSGADSDTGNGIGELSLARYTWLIYVVLAIVTVAVLIYLIQIIIRKGRRFVYCHQKNYREAVIACYANVCDMIRLCDQAFNSCKSHREQLLYINAKYLSISDLEQLCEWLETISFSEAAIPETYLTQLREMTVQIQKAVWKTEKWRNKLRLLKR
ncbi:MAG: transglutaminase-like domain-containing protein [Lachnospiraceae bacterium]|nr:transglutaminase-like domain-containing protein [Lachnospiraceae bacterium]MDE6625766.1 transglutaminase-like domain-containing protein [Lachnospiraceae bacterium]